MRGQAPRRDAGRLRSCCHLDTALTVGALRAAWANSDDASPVLVSKSPFVADWAQYADVIVTDGGVLVARLIAPFAKQPQPAPGTVWAPASTIRPAMHGGVS